jgi:hypothetical protein
MQTHGFIFYNNEKIKVLARTKKIPGEKFCLYVSFKLRTSGQDGQHMTDEQGFLTDRPDLIEQLKNGETITL